MNRKLNPGKALAGIIDWGIFVIASLMLYAKTSEVFARFAPASFFGFTDVQVFYGMTCALLVEGVLFLGKLSVRHSENSSVFLWNFLLIAFTWAVSSAAQVFDGFLTAGTLANQPITVQYAVTYGIPLIPSFVLAAVLVKSLIAAMPENSEKAPTKAVNSTARPLAEPAIVQYMSDTSGLKVRRNELTAEDWDFIAAHNTRQVSARFGVSGRVARDWKKAAKSGIKL